MKSMPNTPMVAVFDTAFHQTMEPEDYIYPVPYEWYSDYGVRKYGFHGTSHRFIAKEVEDNIGPNLKVISCHLGSGASICAIKEGKSIDTSMGFSPLAGLMMGTRSGDIDESLIPYVVNKTGKTYDEVFEDLNKRSGFLGVSGVSSDSRDIEEGIKEGNERCILASKIFNQRVADYIASYNNKLGGADVIVFTAGLGENSIDTRTDIVKRIASLGVEIDLEKNDVRGKFTKISTDDSKIAVYVIPTNEELMIAKDTYDLVK